jgi:ribosomal protein S18 acetylase RimI-like enzyme
LTIAGFQVAMAAETEGLHLDGAVVEKGVQAVFERPELGKYFVALEEDRVVASLLITYEWSDWRSTMIWWIQSVYVRPDLRRRGIFRTMFRHIRDLVMADDSVSGLRLYVDKSNERAREVYRRLGMDGDHYALYEWMK